MRAVGVVVILLSLAPWCKAQQGAMALLERAHALQQTAQYEQALPFLRQAAALGMPQAQYELGKAYHAGQGVTRNDTLAISWLEKAAQRQYVPAQRTLGGEFWYSGLVSKKRALAWLQAGAAAGDFESLVHLHHRCDSTYAQNPAPLVGAYALQLRKQIAAWAKPVQKHDSATVFQAAFQLGVWYHEGYRLAKDPVESYAWFLLMNEMLTLETLLIRSEAFLEHVSLLHPQLTPAQRTLALRRAETLGQRKLRRLPQFNEALTRFKPVNRVAEPEQGGGW
ncbi:hypothetical protein GCM10027348_16510 [Hymenobacter tenuis]